MPIFPILTGRPQPQTWTEFHQRYGSAGGDPYGHSNETPTSPIRSSINYYFTLLLLRCLRRQPDINEEDDDDPIPPEYRATRQRKHNLSPPNSPMRMTTPRSHLMA